MKKPIPGTLVEYNKDGFDEYPYIDEGIGYIEFFNEQQQYVKVFMFKKIRHMRKNWAEILFDPASYKYELQEFNKLFYILPLDR